MRILNLMAHGIRYPIPLSKFVRFLSVSRRGARARAITIRFSITCLLLTTAILITHVEAKEADSSQLKWYRGNTHAHTFNSDGDSSPEAVARWYREHGYHFLVITDHEFVTNVEPINALLGAENRFLVLSGQEITQWSEEPGRSGSFLGASAHVNALFSNDTIWPVGVPKCSVGGCGASSPANVPIAETLKANIAAIHSQGAIAQVNHPNGLWSLRPEDLAHIPDGTLLEIWNGGVGPAVSEPSANNLGGDDGDGDTRPSAEGFWDWLLSRGKIVWGVGTDDSHTFSKSGHAWIVVRAPRLAASDLKTAISNGNFYASTGVAYKDVAIDAAQLIITIAPPIIEWAPNYVPRYSTKFIGQNGATLATVSGLKPNYRFTGSESYVRAVTSDSSGRQAWSQPVFLDGRDKKKIVGNKSRTGRFSSN